MKLTHHLRILSRVGDKKGGYARNLQNYFQQYNLPNQTMRNRHHHNLTTALSSIPTTTNPTNHILVTNSHRSLFQKPHNHGNSLLLVLPNITIPQSSSIIRSVVTMTNDNTLISPPTTAAISTRQLHGTSYMMMSSKEPSSTSPSSRSEKILHFKEKVKSMTNEELDDPTTIPGFTSLIHSPPIDKKTTPRNALVGTVVSDKMSKTVNVSVDRYKIIPKYKKRWRYTKKFMAHDESEVCREGDLVMIAPCQKLSKRKHFRVHQIIKAKGSIEDRGILGNIGYSQASEV